MASNAVRHPLHIDLHRQTQLFIPKVPQNNAHASIISSATTTSAILAALSDALAHPALTLLIEEYYRPILFELCARWITKPTITEDQIVAICLLIEVHEELFPILYRLLTRSELKNGLLAGCPTHISDKHRVNKLLLAYYRILQTNRELPSQLLWSLAPLSAIIWNPSFDSASRLLAIRCYALQSGMGEAQRNDIERDVLGEICGIECLLYYADVDNTPEYVDGWIMPVIEIQRIKDARMSIATSSQSYFANMASIQPSDLCPLVSDIEGVLLLRSSDVPSPSSPLIRTGTTQNNLRSVGQHLSLRVPILLTSPPSSGKTTLITHLAASLFPGASNHVVTIHLADTSLDPRSLLGSYVSSASESGTFEWKEGVLVRAMRQGKWIIFKDIDRASPEVLGILKPLVESYGLSKWIGGCGHLDLPGRGRVTAHQDFVIFATRSVMASRAGTFPSSLFLGAHKFFEISITSPTVDDLQMIFSAKFPRMGGAPVHGLIRLWEKVKNLGTPSSMRAIGLRELEKYCMRIDALLPSSFQSSVDLLSSDVSTLPTLFPNTHFREQMFLQARDIFFGAASLTSAAQSHTTSVIEIVADHLGLEPDRRDWLLQGWAPDFKIERDVNNVVVGVRSNHVSILANPPAHSMSTPSHRPFAMHRPAVLLLSRISTAASLNEPILLTGETGTGKTSVITHLASLLRKPLMSLNLSHQTESADLVGGFKPVDARVPASILQERFLDLFGTTFSRRKNEKFEKEVRKAVNDGKWKRAVGLWKESAKLARDRFRAKNADEVSEAVEERHAKTPRKRRKLDAAPETAWVAFENDVEEFEIHHVHGKGRFAFDFVEGPLVKAVRNGDWVLLDEINLASSETLECISTLLQSTTSSITLTEQGSLEPVPRHPDFRLFACMNPATDVGKKDLPPNIRCRFTEIDVPPPDTDKDTLISIVTQYIGHVAVGDNKRVIMDVAEFYVAVKQLAESRTIADGSNHRPHFSMRTLARTLTFAADIAGTYGLQRAIWEGCLMAFTMVLDAQSVDAVTSLAQKHLLAGVRNPRSMLSKVPAVPSDEHIRFGPFFLEKGPLHVDSGDEYILTPSVESKLVDLSRIILTRRFPVLIEGPTSSGKTSSVEYLAKRTGHQFVRINNHEHTDIQEYLGSYVADPITGKLVFQDGLLVRALRYGHWIVLDELNLAPTDVLEALNRLLDDNRELVIPETQEVVKPHPHFMIFATQNPPGLYAGRKILSRAFRNRFLEVHFEDVPEAELETILCQRSRIAPSYGKKIVSVFRELQNRRQSGRVFESKFGFATLRDLFRWANRDAMSYQELANNGYMLLAERARRSDDKAAVKEVIEKVMGVAVDEAALYDLLASTSDMETFLGCPIPSTSSVIWTKAMQRLFILLSRALRFNEPVLLVGETGCGKTSVCQVFAQINSQQLHTLNCHQGTETADLIGGLRPIRNRPSLEADILRDAIPLAQQLGIAVSPLTINLLTSAITKALKAAELDPQLRHELQAFRLRIGRLNAIFEWHDGPLVAAMNHGDVFLLDEISLADDSVLERLNSVLESSRTIILAEKGGDNASGVHVTASETFKLVATMNPGGDYGKKELSPALRNRFTEIWVPAVDSRDDLELIVTRTWKHDELRHFTASILDFVDWLCSRVGDRTLMNLRDIISWVEFSNAAFSREGALTGKTIFHHAAHMTFIDGLASLSQLSGYPKETISQLKTDAISQLEQLVPIDSVDKTDRTPLDPSRFFQLGSFSLPRGPHTSSAASFNFQAPTTSQNAARVVRASQLMKPILLEGSPGVGKTSLVTALALASGHELCRINLSDQTDLADLFGSDLPVEGGNPGEFAWRNAEFLKALVEGHWVLLDEMNLAPQAVLEGLNSVLDHRGTVFIPELGRSFVRHPSFRIFAAQNPLNQGSGRKGLPKSFLNRFTKVYVDELSPSDLHLVCCHLFPDMDPEILRSLVAFNTQLSTEVTTKRAFGREGSPWEFNLRDVIRWGTSISQSACRDPVHSLRAIYLHRFRNAVDRERASHIFDHVFHTSTIRTSSNPPLYISPQYCQVGVFHTPRLSFMPLSRSGRILKTQLTALEAIGVCVNHAWLSILMGHRHSGKTHLVRLLASITGHHLRELSLSSATEAADILGSFEQVDFNSRLVVIIKDVLTLADIYLRSNTGSATPLDAVDILRSLNTQVTDGQAILGIIATVLDGLHDMYPDVVNNLRTRAAALRKTKSAQFEWFDGPLVDAMKNGHWLLLDGANLCNPSVLDRLNSVCEMDGRLTLNERGHVDGSVVVITPHPSFRLFMTADPQYGELSRAMRNRGIEIALLDPPSNTGDDEIVSDFLRIPRLEALDSSSFDAARRGMFVVPMTDDTRITSLGSPLLEDSSLSYLLDQAPRLLTSLRPHSRSLEAVLYFVAHSTVPAFKEHELRFLGRALPADYKLVIPFLRNYPGFGRDAINKMRIHLSSMRDVRLALSSVQPSICFDVEETLAGEDAIGIQSMCLPLLDLITTFMLESQAPYESVGIELSSEMHKSVRTTVLDLRRAAEDTVRDILDTFSRGVLASSDLELGSQILKYTRLLEGAIQQPHLDYSSLRAIGNWLTDALNPCTPTFSTVQSFTDTLLTLVSPSSGLGLSNMWMLFLEAPKSVITDIQLNGVMTLLKGKEDGRRRIFNLIALSLAAETEEAGILDRLITESTKHDISAREDERDNEPTPTDTLTDTSILLVELDFLAARLPNPKLLGSFLDTVCQYFGASLSRMAPYQLVLWQKESVNSIMIQQQLQWMKDLWAAPPMVHMEGPATLLRPTNLIATLSLCNLQASAMGTYLQHVQNMKRNIRLLLLQCEGGTHRPQLLEMFLAQSLRMTSEAFALSHDDGVDVSKQYQLFETARRELAPKSLEATASQNDQLVSTGYAWISFARMLLQLTVPDIPVDPATAQHIRGHYVDSQASLLADQITLHQQLDLMLTGNETSTVVAYLQKRHNLVVAEMQNKKSFTRNDVYRLQMFWSEVTQFSSVISTSRIDDLLQKLAAGQPMADAQEESVQQSIHTLLQRLNTTYTDFSDLTAVVEYALQHLRIGLRIVRHVFVDRATSEAMEHFGAALAAFPSMRSSSLLVHSHSPSADLPDVTQRELLTLAAISFERKASVSSFAHLRTVKQAYDKILGCWLLDQEKAKKEELASQSLYRRKDDSYEDLSDEEREEREFRELFPSFDDILDEDRTSFPVAHGPSKSQTVLVTSQHMNLLLAIHLSIINLLDSRTLSDPEEHLQHFLALRIQSMTSLPLPSLSDEMDGNIILQLHHFQQNLPRSESNAKILVSNFYVDANVDELGKAVIVINALRLRILRLTEEWPDQMVLHHLVTRCDAVLSLPLGSSVARILSALEQLLLQTEDWELFANRTNNLNSERSALISLIVEWRRMELSCWDTLLDSEQAKFQDGIEDWWFRLYDALFRGSVAAFEQAADEGGDEGLTTYLGTLLPMLDQFIRDSPLGQFHPRMRLIRSFESYCRLVIPALSPSYVAERTVFSRIQHLLKATLDAFDLYSPAVSSRVHDQRSSLEKEIKSFIKLASWKDINVHALKASAQRTHHQLYKIIRKFREVLRAPVAPILIPYSTSKGERDAEPVQSLSVRAPGSSYPQFPHYGATSGHSHLDNLDRTYTKLVDLLFGKIRPFISSLFPSHVEDLGVEILTGIESLSATPISPDLSAEKRTKAFKALLVRKRKAWSDLLKELKRAGFATNLSADVLQRQQDSRWIREQPSFTPGGTFAFTAIADKGEHYFRRLDEALKDLRASIAGHHADLTTRELQRGLTFMESCFSMAIESRAKLVAHADGLLRLQRSLKRLQMMTSSVQHSGPAVLEYVVDASNLLYRLGNVLEEGVMSLRLLNDFDFSTEEILLLEEVQKLKESVLTMAKGVRSTVECVQLSDYPVILEDEANIVNDALKLVEGVKVAISDFAANYPRSRRIFKDVHDWLSSQHIPSISDNAEPIPESIDCDSIINACLVSMQGFVGKYVEIPEDNYDRDNYIRADYRLVVDLTHTANLPSIAKLADKAIAAVVSGPERLTYLKRFLPFLEQYYQLAEEQLTAHAAWTKSLFKLSFILCSLLRTLAKEGFCKPPEMEDPGAGEEGSATVDGMGMGEGTGAKNVSKEIEEEHQVEGLKGEEDQNEDDNAQDEEDNAIEMDDDVGGDMKDVPDTGSQDGSESEQEEEEGPDEQLGDLDTSDPDAVDEKLWGDEKGPDDSAPEEKTDKDHSEQKSDDSEVAAKEGDSQSDGKEKKEKEDAGKGENSEGKEDEEVPEEQVPEDQDPQASGAPMDEHVPEADTLDLPDDMDLGLGEEEGGNERDEDLDMEEGDEGEDKPGDEGMQEQSEDEMDDSGVPDNSQAIEDQQDDEMETAEDGDPNHAEPLKDDEQPPEEQSEESALAPPDIGKGIDDIQPNVAQNADVTDDAAGEAQGSSGAGGGESAEAERNTQPSLPQNDSMQIGTEQSDDIGESGSGVQQGQQPQTQAQENMGDSRRSLGDALKEARQTFEDILQNQGSSDKPDTQAATQMEYLQPEDGDEEMQALGPSGEEQTAKLAELKLIDDDAPPQEDTPMDVDAPDKSEDHIKNEKDAWDGESPQKDQSTDAPQGAIMNLPSMTSTVNPDATAPKGDVDMEDTPPAEDVEVHLRHWQEAGAPAEGAEHIWRLYESLTHDLAYALCEQLRLILEPTLATRLKGDYRTGKRLNMKKIIPYIASDYTKDKIWLRRTRPSQREYQILIALDDSRSMSESHSVHLAYQTMALVSKALTRLEAGDIGIAKFGQSVDILHGFTDGPFTDQTGTRVLSSFRFDQKATNVLSLVDRSLQVLEKARETRSMSSSSSADLWQLEVIISDGICQDHEELRSVLRKAEEQRVMIVFIIIDSLDTQQGSIFTMEKADFQNVDGRMELKLNRYLDTFPFEYYVVLRDVEALPGVLATTLKQFFERISEE